MGVVTASVMAQQGLTAHDENKTDETGREVEVEALAKAVKSDDAEVPVDLWDQAVRRAPPSEVEEKALTVVRDFMLARYHRRLWLDARKYLQVTHGKDWCHSRHTRVLEDVTTIHDILWRAASNTWFEYPLGSRLIFFRFP